MRFRFPIRTSISALLLFGCANGDGGAVAVRWKLIDPRTGAQPGSCVGRPTDPGTCCVNTGQDVTIDTVRLRVVALGGSPGPSQEDVPCPSCCFPCSPFEHTTRFELPTGTYVLSLVPLRCGVPVGETPPGVVRNVRTGEITNLDAVEIRIPPSASSPASCGDGGVPGCVDGGR